MLMLFGKHEALMFMNFMSMFMFKAGFSRYKHSTADLDCQPWVDDFFRSRRSQLTRTLRVLAQVNQSQALVDVKNSFGSEPCGQIRSNSSQDLPKKRGGKLHRFLVIA